MVWDKSVVVLALEREGMLSHPQTCAVAASVEEKVLGMGIGQVTAGLVRKLVGNELIALCQAEEALGSLRVGEKTRGGEQRKARTAVAATAVDAGLGAAREVAAERCPA